MVAFQVSFFDYIYADKYYLDLGSTLHTKMALMSVLPRILGGTRPSGKEGR